MPTAENVGREDFACLSMTSSVRRQDGVRETVCTPDLELMCVNFLSFIYPVDSEMCSWKRCTGKTGKNQIADCVHELLQ